MSSVGSTPIRSRQFIIAYYPASRLWITSSVLRTIVSFVDRFTSSIVYFVKLKKHVTIKIGSPDDVGHQYTERINELLEITDIARDKIKEVLDKNTGKYLRITIEAG